MVYYCHCTMYWICRLNYQQNFIFKALTGSEIFDIKLKKKMEINLVMQMEQTYSDGK